MTFVKGDDAPTANPARNRWLKPFIQLLRQGVSPEKIALTIALGIILGITPVLGSTMLLCTLAAIVFRLNYKRQWPTRPVNAA